MIKKIVSLIIIVLIIFIGLMYWSVSSTEKTFIKSDLVNYDNVNAVNFKAIDSVMVTASSLYKADEIKTLIQGEQYRQAWATPIKVPVMYLDTLLGGVTILKEGGGKQTHSLKLITKDSIELTLRGVNKDPKKLIPEIAETLGLENIIVDGISAQHPYGAILAAELADKANLLNTKPKVVFVPKQKTLKQYSDKYRNRLYLLEYETESKTNWTELDSIVNTIDTEDLQELKLKYPEKVFINKTELIRARLFDLLIGDWDRHTKQWGWAIQDTNGKYIAHPIAGDRDNAFFNLEGIVPTLLSNKYVVEELRPFENDIDFMPGLVYPFDRYFLLNTPEALFVDQAKQLQIMLNDSVLEQALKVWPKSIADLDGKEIINKIKSRRDDLVNYAKAFKASIDEKGKLQQQLKGSEDLDIDSRLMECFECINKN
ncbi:hypothetical protein [Olleya aquimaris]|uniref:Uncharacterized protein n=1 Tax=Olleya aquimaris TaxID=639310 RepID=A0A327RJA0_9FLAO|nr:hypothetical protein [Olleya aquimaris]RAJ16298.1 hypothetical protein LY08_01156 [Olleya aquimaris]